MEWGPREEFLIGISETEPAAPLLEKPELDDMERYYWRVFHDLNASRPVGFGAASVPISEILAYCELYGINDINERSDLVYIMAEMNSEFIEHFSKKKANKHMAAGGFGSACPAAVCSPTIDTG